MEPLGLSAFTSSLTEAFGRDDPTVGAKALEATHLETTRSVFEALGRGDLSSFLARMHPDVRLEIFAPPDFPWIRRAHGVQELRTAVEHNFTTLIEQQTDVLAVVVQGDILILSARERGRLRASKAQYDVHFVYQFTFRDAKVWRIREVAAPTNV